ncbi:hypothetical protein ACFX13_039025 [Malus domestica]
MDLVKLARDYHLAEVFVFKFESPLIDLNAFILPLYVMLVSFGNPMRKTGAETHQTDVGGRVRLNNPDQLLHQATQPSLGTFLGAPKYPVF